MPVKKRFPANKKTRLIAAILAVMLVGAGTALALSWLNQKKDSAPKAAVITPDFSTVLPKDRSIESLGGWSRVSPEKSDPVYAFNDSLATVPISVSQQPVPASFAHDPATALRELAKGFGATTPLALKNGQTAYLGTSAKGPQSVIFATNTTLILIKSQNKIPTDAWKNYIQSLQ